MFIGFVLGLVSLAFVAVVVGSVLLWWDDKRNEFEDYVARLVVMEVQDYLSER